jgi:hypothetical protein
MPRANHSYFNQMSQLSKAQSSYDRILPPDDDCDLSTSEVEFLQEMKFEGILDARESRERSEW